MLRNPSFWTEEKDASILVFNKDEFLQKNADKADEHAKRWLSNLGVKPVDLNFFDIDTKPVVNPARIFLRDAERTYRGEANRQTLMKVLTLCENKFGDYQQSMGYAAGLLLLFHDAATTIKVLTVLNDSPKYLAGYWKGEQTGCAIDCWVLFDLLEKVQPKLRAHMLSKGMQPHTFVQKWFAGLCINHLPYDLLLPFLDEFTQHGLDFLFRFGLAFFKVNEEELLAKELTNQLSSFVRFDGVPHETLVKVLEEAKKPNAVVTEQLNLHKAREFAFKTHLQKSLMNANAQMIEAMEDDGIEFSSSEDESDQEDAVDELAGKVSNMAV